MRKSSRVLKKGMDKGGRRSTVRWSTYLISILQGHILGLLATAPLSSMSPFGISLIMIPNWWLFLILLITESQLWKITYYNYSYGEKWKAVKHSTSRDTNFKWNFGFRNFATTLTNFLPLLTTLFLFYTHSSKPENVFIWNILFYVTALWILLLNWSCHDHSWPLSFIYL